MYNTKTNYSLILPQACTCPPLEETLRSWSTIIIMINKKAILTLVIIIFSHYCWGQRYFNDEVFKSEKKYYTETRIKQFILAKKDFVLNDTLVVSTNAVYVVPLTGAKTEGISYKYFRFFKDGRFFYSFPYLSYPSEKEFNDLDYGIFGWYIINKKGELHIEYRIRRMSHNMWWEFYRPIENGDLQYFKGHGQGYSLFPKEFKNGYICRKHYVKLYSQPE